MAGSEGVLTERQASELPAKPGNRLLMALGTLRRFIRGGVRREYDIDGEELGRGCYGVVRRATHLQTGECRAVKVVSKEDKDEKGLRNVHREIAVMRQLNHENVIRLHDVFESRHHFYILMEPAMGGQLLEKILIVRRLSEDEAACVFQQLLHAVAYLHAQGIVHRDIKCENVLYSEPGFTGRIKLIDFGLSRVVETPQSLDSGRVRFFTRCGSPNYVAPEVLDRAGYGKQIDAWSTGVILYILLSGVAPFPQATTKAKFESIRKGLFAFPPHLFGHITAAAKELISGMLAHDETMRYTCTQGLAHPWFRLYKARGLPTVVGAQSQRANGGEVGDGGAASTPPSVGDELQAWDAVRKLRDALVCVHWLGRVRAALVCGCPAMMQALEGMRRGRGAEGGEKGCVRALFEMLDKEGLGRVCLKRLAVTLAVLRVDAREEGGCGSGRGDPDGGRLGLEEGMSVERQNSGSRDRLEESLCRVVGMLRGERARGWGAGDCERGQVALVSLPTASAVHVVFSQIALFVFVFGVGVGKGADGCV